MTTSDTHDGTERILTVPRANPALTREPLLGSAFALLTLTAFHQVRRLPWPIWTAWGATALVAAAQSIRSRRRCDATMWAADRVVQDPRHTHQAEIGVRAWTSMAMSWIRRGISGVGRA
jgi:hypothetical protein